MRKYIIILLFIIILLPCIKIRGMSNESKDLEYDEIQNVLDNVLSSNTIDFDTFVKDLVSGKEVFSIRNILNKTFELIKHEFGSNFNILGKLISIVLVSAIFTNISLAFKNEQASETGYYVIYLLLFTMMMTTFITASNIAREALEGVMIFIKVLVPTYFMAVGFSTGIGSSVVFYEMSLIIISFAEVALLNIVLPFINIYLVVMLVNNLSKEDVLSKFADLMATIIKWLLNTLLGAVIGFNAIQGMITPMIDKVKRSAIIKASQSIPGVGNAIEGVAETILGTSLLLKNSIGVVGMIIIIVISAVPIIKLGIIVFVYKLCGAIIQPIADKRVLKCISSSAKSSYMLLQTLFIGMFLFVLSIAIVTVSTMK